MCVCVRKRMGSIDTKQIETPIFGSHCGHISNFWDVVMRAMEGKRYRKKRTFYMYQDSTTMQPIGILFTRKYHYNK